MRQGPPGAQSAQQSARSAYLRSGPFGAGARALPGLRVPSGGRGVIQSRSGSGGSCGAGRVGPGVQLLRGG